MRKYLTTLIAAAILAGCAAHYPQLHGMQFEPPQPAADFTLTDEDGRSFSLSQTRGQALALYFGFTHCKDTCPQTLALLGKARERAGLRPAQMRIVMVSVDPKHDTPAAFRAFFNRVGVKATGLTGSESALSRVYHAYGVFVQPQKDDVTHPDLIFVIDAQGRIRETLAPQTALNDVAADLRAVVD